MNKLGMKVLLFLRENSHSFNTARSTVLLSMQCMFVCVCFSFSAATVSFFTWRPLLEALFSETAFDLSLLDAATVFMSLHFFTRFCLNGCFANRSKLLAIQSGTFKK